MALTRRQRRRLVRDILVIGLVVGGGAAWAGWSWHHRESRGLPALSLDRRLDFRLEKDSFRQWLGSQAADRSIALMIDSGKTDEAMQALEELLQKDPLNLGALVESALLARFERNRPDLALPMMEKALTITKDPWPIALALVDMYEEERLFERGMSYLDSESHPHRQLVASLRAELQLRSGDVAATLGTLAQNPGQTLEDQALRDVLRAEAQIRSGLVMEGAILFKSAEAQLDDYMQQEIRAEKSVDHWVRWLDIHRLNVCEQLMQQGQMTLAEPMLTQLAERLPHVARVRQLMRQLSGA